mmetsp:Transcript_2395/g.4728  ORF Transcript_2395/g.4728 Transcript_2395/m.4728 type:complete len:290 (+) Transcript_2395:76-945(+)
MGCVYSAGPVYEKKTENAKFFSVHPDRVLQDAPVAFPSYWQNIGGDMEFAHLISCEGETGTSEWEAVQALLDATFDKKQTASRLLVQSLRRVEDAAMWGLYEQSVAWIIQCRANEEIPIHKMLGKDGEVQDVPLTTAALPDSWKARIRLGANEAYLWHGTSLAAAESIAKNDFRISSAGSAHGKKLGKGAYLAGSAALGDKYSVCDKTGVYAMLLVRAALGLVLVTTKRSAAWSNKAKDSLDTSKVVKTGQWDSVLGDRRKAVGTHREYCVAFSHQLYPEYLITYKREP